MCLRHIRARLHRAICDTPDVAICGVSFAACGRVISQPFQMTGVFKERVMMRRFLVLFGLCTLASCCLLTGCDSLEKAHDFCEDVIACGYNQFRSVDECVDLVEAEYDNYPQCESKIEVYYDCIEKEACKTSSVVSWPCDKYKEQRDICERQNP